LYATTRQFLDDLGLASLDGLPLLENPTQQGSEFESLAMGAVQDVSDEAVIAVAEPADDGQMVMALEEAGDGIGQTGDCGDVVLSSPDLEQKEAKHDE
jgi:segregation and condensation protein B